MKNLILSALVLGSAFAIANSMDRQEMALDRVALTYGPVKCYSAPSCKGFIGTTGTADMCKVAGGSSYSPVGSDVCRGL